MADWSSDIYAVSRKDLRDTLKWYIAALCGIAAALAGSISFAIIPDLKGDALLKGIILGAALLGIVLAALSMVYSLLAVTPFGAERLRDKQLTVALAPYLPELLPGDVPDMDALDRMLKDEEAQQPRNLAEIQRLEALAVKVSSFGAFLDLERRTRETNAWLLALFCLGCVLLVMLTSIHASAKAQTGVGAMAIQFAPGASWSDYAARLAETCPGATYSATGKADAPMKGWWTITLDGPVCKGVTIAVPAAVVSVP